MTACPLTGHADDPAFGFRLEGTDPLGTGDDFDGPFAECGDRVAQLVAAVDAIGEDVPQFRERSPQRGEQRHRAVIVLDVGRVHQESEQEALCIGDHVALAPLDPLGGIKPARATTFRGFGALAVDDAGRGNGVAACRLPGTPHQGEIDPMPDAPVAPVVEVILNGRARRKVLRQRPPLAAGRQDVEDRVHHLAQIDFARTPDPARCRQKKADQKPFRIGRIACITQVIAPILRTGGFSPSHCDLHRFSQIRRNHKGLKSLNSFSARL